MKQRLDVELVNRRITTTRSQAENWIRLGKVIVDNIVIVKPGYFVKSDADITLTATERYVSRAGLKLASVSDVLGLNFNHKTVLDIGSSTGGFTDYAIQNGAVKVYAVDIGTDQLHPTVRNNPAVEVYEKTDIRHFHIPNSGKKPDMIVIDVSFISLRDILPYVANALCDKDTAIIAMVKPQFEVGKMQIHKGVLKNDTIRRQVLKDFEIWAKHLFVIINKHDSGVSGAKGNQERFYLLKPLAIH